LCREAAAKAWEIVSDARHPTVMTTDRRTESPDRRERTSAEREGCRRPHSPTTRVCAAGSALRKSSDRKAAGLSRRTREARALRDAVDRLADAYGRGAALVERYTAPTDRLARISFQIARRFRNSRRLEPFKPRGRSQLGAPQ
jgi:hypothetical protein